MDYIIYHNPRCSKSRQTLELLHTMNIKPQVRYYLEAPLSQHELIWLVAALGVPATALLRTGEADYQRLVEQEGLPDDATAIRWISENPKLMERPIVVHGQHARIGRPPAAVLDLIRSP